MKIINRTVPTSLKTLGYDQPQIDGVLDYIEKNDTIEGAPELKPEHLPVFDCAFKAAKGTRTIGWTAHIGMMNDRICWFFWTLQLGIATTLTTVISV